MKQNKKTPSRWRRDPRFPAATPVPSARQPTAACSDKEPVAEIPASAASSLLGQAGWARSHEVLWIGFLLTDSLPHTPAALQKLGYCL